MKVSDCLCAPLRSGSFDAVLSIAAWPLYLLSQLYSLDQLLAVVVYLQRFYIICPPSLGEYRRAEICREYLYFGIRSEPLSQALREAAPLVSVAG